MSEALLKMSLNEGDVRLRTPLEDIFSVTTAGCSKRPTARPQEARIRGVLYLVRRESERPENAAVGLFQHPVNAEVVEWQTRTFEGRVAQAVRVQVPPSAPNSIL